MHTDDVSYEDTINVRTYTYTYTYTCTGGAEQAMMSTTSNLSVAVRYSLSAGSLLFKIKVDAWTDHGAGGRQMYALLHTYIPAYARYHVA